MRTRTNAKLCVLCLQNLPIENSHIVPKLILKWILENAPVDHLRWSHIPNKPFQDGWKADYFCEECEGRLSKIESQFKTEFFDPIIGSKAGTVQYTDYLLPFTLSLYFRHLKFSLDHDPSCSATEPLMTVLESLRTKLWSFLYDGTYPELESYVVYLPFVTESTAFEPGVNQYFLAVDGFWFDYCIPPDKVFYIGGVKIPKLQFVFSEKPLRIITNDEECRAEVGKSKIGRYGSFARANHSRVIIEGLFREDYNKRAVDLRRNIENLSNKQIEKIVKEIASHANAEATIFHKAYEKDLVLASFREQHSQSSH